MSDATTKVHRFPVTDADLDAPDGAVVDGHERVGSEWVRKDDNDTTPHDRVWLIGEQNPYGSEPEYDLYPAPDGCAGWRLCRVLGLTRADYLRTFVRRNLLRGEKWSATAAKVAAVAVEDDFRKAKGRTLVLCGAKVAAAFGFRDFRAALLVPDLGTPLGAALLPDERPKGTPALVIPHPSGRSREWNDPDVAARVRAQVMALAAAPAVAPQPKSCCPKGATEPAPIHAVLGCSPR